LRAVVDFASVGVDARASGNIRALAVVLLAGKEVLKGATIFEILGDVAIKICQGLASLVEGVELAR